MKPPRLRWVIFSAIITFLLVVILVSFLREMKRVDKLSRALDSKMEELVVEKRRTQQLQQKIDYYTSPEGIARLAREQFNLVQSGEQIYKIEIVSKDKNLQR